jgi:hypothetical protein
MTVPVTPGGDPLHRASVPAQAGATSRAAQRQTPWPEEGRQAGMMVTSLSKLTNMREASDWSNNVMRLCSRAVERTIFTEEGEFWPFERVTRPPGTSREDPFST